jgi:hypothetical protein
MTSDLLLSSRNGAFFLPVGGRARQKKKNPDSSVVLFPIPCALFGSESVAVCLFALTGLIAAAVDVDLDGRRVATIALLPKLAGLDATFDPG